MRRFILAAMLAAGTLTAPAWGQSPEKATFADVKKELTTKLRGAKEVAEKEKLAAEYGPQLVAFAEAGKGSEAAERVGFLLNVAVVGHNADLRKSAAALIRAQVKTAAAADYLKILAALPDEGNIVLLKEVLEANPDKLIQAKAAKALAQANESLAQMAKATKDKEVKKRLTERYGEGFVKHLAADAEEFAGRAFEYKELLATKYEGVLPRPEIGKPAPTAVCKDLDGKEVKLTDYKGKVVVVDFWATWCGYCVQMIPHERELVERLKDKPFALISVSVDESTEVVRKFLKKTDMPWVHWFNGPGGQLLEDWEVEGYPTIYVIDHKGVVRFSDVRGKKMDEAVDQLLKEMEAEKKKEK